MNLTLQSHIYPVSITLSARIKAEQFSREQSNPQKAQQVYKNTLAVSAVNIYLKYSGWITSLNTSDSWNPIMQSLMNVADLDIPDYGKVECCFVESNSKFFVIPPEVRENRIAYIAVSLTPSLQSATILGFIPEFTDNKVLLSQLRSITELPDYLEQWKNNQEITKLVDSPLTKLRQWLEGVVEAGWQTLDEIFPPCPSLGFRNSQQFRHRNINSPESLDEGISRVKLLDLASSEATKTIALILSIKEQAKDLDISVKVCPTNTNNYLPKGLEIFILDQQQQTVMHAQANNTRNIEFRFSGESGEYFSIKACLNQNAQIETFAI